MPIPRDYQKMFRRKGASGETYEIAQIFRPPEYRELTLIGWLRSDFEVEVVSQLPGEADQAFFSRLERESIVKEKIATVRLLKSREGGLMAKINGRISFPAHSQPVPPEAQPGKLWKVEVTGENKKGTVYFFRFLENAEKPCEHTSGAFGTNVEGKVGLFYFCSNCGASLEKPE